VHSCMGFILFNNDCFAPEGFVELRIVISSLYSFKIKKPYLHGYFQWSHLFTLVCFFFQTKTKLIMKNVFIAIMLFVLLNKIHGQKEKVTIYDITFSAKEITGQKKFVSTSDYYRTKLLSPLIEKNENEYLYDLGSYRNDYTNMETLDLFNLSLQKRDYPFLDSIDFDYYQNLGFDLVAKRTPGIEEDQKFKTLQSRLDTAQSIKLKKQILFDPQYTLLRNQLILSRYDVITKSFTVDKKKVSKVTAELKAQLDTILIDNNLQGNANLRAYLSRLADEAVNIVGYYYDARLNPGYVSKIKYYVETTPSIKLGDDQFAHFLRDYLINTKAAANSGLVALQLDGTLNKTKIRIDSIASDLQSKFQIPAEKAATIAMSINFTFSKNETVTLKNKFNSVFILRYFTSKLIDGIESPQQRFSDLSSH
jgi:hypothetical protein